MADDAPEAKVCSACGASLTRDAYSAKQWKARSRRRCAACVGAGRAVGSTDSAAATEAPAASAAASPAPLTDAAASTEWRTHLDGLTFAPLDDKMAREVFSPGVNAAGVLQVYRGEATLAVDACSEYTGGEITMALIEVVGEAEGAAYKLAYACMQMPPGEDGRSSTGVQVAGDLPAMLTDRQKRMLQARVLHLALGALELDPWVVEYAIAYLERHYEEKRRYEPLAHACRLAVGVCEYGKKPWRHYMVALGEALEAAGRFSDAAPVYTAIAASPWCADGVRECGTLGQAEAATCWNNAALAWKRAGEWDRAEAYYFRALQRDGRCPDASKTILPNIQNFYVNYQLYVLQSRDRATDPRYRPIFFLTAGLGGLLGARPRDDSKGSERVDRARIGPRGASAARPCAKGPRGGATARDGARRRPRRGRHVGAPRTRVVRRRTRRGGLAKRSRRPASEF